MFRYVVVATFAAVVFFGGRARGTTADDLCAPDADPCIVTARVTITDGSVLAFGVRDFVVAAGGALDVGSGTMTVMAGTIGVGGSVNADGGSGGQIVLTAVEALWSNGLISANGTSPAGIGGSVDLLGGVVAIAGEVSARGMGDGLGGCVTVGADGNIDLIGSLRVTGGDGGEIVLAAGLVAGDLSIGGDAVLNTSGAGANGGSGGGIDLSARGDGIANGHVRIDGNLQARAGSLQGGDGGCITVSAAGDVVGEGSTAELNVNSGTPDGFAGEISIVAGGKVELRTKLLAQGTGSEGTGGDVEVRAGTDLVVDEEARISVAGPGDGGSVELTADQGEVLIRSDFVDASGTAGGDGGDIRIGAGGTQGRIVVAGSVLANGSTSGGAPGRGGTIEVSAGNTLILPGSPTVGRGRLQAQGGTGGVIMMRTLRGSLQLNGAISAGGAITAASGGELAVGGTLAASDNFRGGRIGLEANGPLTIDGTLDASVLPTAGSGGTIELVGAGPVSVTGRLNTDSIGTAGTVGGNVMLRGCDINLAQSSSLSAKGNGGANRVIGRRAIVVAGVVMSDAATGHNELVYRDAANPPVIFASADIVPTASLTIDANLPACAICGDNNIEPPETCDDGNQDDGDGCSSTCQVEAARCDVDGNGDVDQTDLLALERELFDGDGDRTLEVGGGDFIGTVGADANGDGRITSADLAGCIELLGAE
jgi:cysteine-rich repeat protein